MDEVEAEQIRAVEDAISEVLDADYEEPRIVIDWVLFAAHTNGNSETGYTILTSDSMPHNLRGLIEFGLDDVKNFGKEE